MKYEGMGVPIGPIMLESIRDHDWSCSYPYLHFGTQMEDYKEAMYILQTGLYGCCLACPSGVLDGIDIWGQLGPISVLIGPDPRSVNLGRLL
jgi:hypothetical protein